MEKTIPQELKERMSNVTQELQEVISDIQTEGLQNTQEALNFIDEINILSVNF